MLEGIMQFKRVLIVTSVIVLICGIAVAVYSGFISKKPSKGTSLEDNGLTSEGFLDREEWAASGTADQEKLLPETGGTSLDEENQTDAVIKEQGGDGKTEPEKTQELKVLNNTLEYDFKAVLVSRKNSGPSLRVSHYLEGTSVEKEFGTDLIDELKRISIVGDNTGVGDPGQAIGTAYLNPRQSKAYLVFRENASEGNMIKMGLYSYNLIDGSLKKLFSDIGSFTDLFFTKDYRFAGFSYYDNHSTGAFEENSLLQILSCEKDEFMVKGSRNAEGKLIGGNTDDKSLYDFVFLAWYSNTTAKLGMTVNPKTVSSSGSNTGKQEEVLYDVTKNIFVDREGNTVSITDLVSKKGESEEVQEIKENDGTGIAKKESETVKLLKEFYTYLLSESDYSKAMNLLDETFKLRIAALSQLGITELAKADINADEATEYASAYAGILRLTSIEKIVSEVKENELVKIYYLQNFTMDKDNKITQPLVAHMKKVDSMWKITLIEDGDINKEPFKN